MHNSRFYCAVFGIAFLAISTTVIGQQRVYKYDNGGSLEAVDNGTVNVLRSLLFGSVRAGSPLTLQLPIQNAGTIPLQIHNIRVSPHFLSAPQELSIQAGDTINLDVTFTPDSVGLFTGTLTANTTDPDQPTISVSLSGTGIAFGFHDPVTISNSGSNPRISAWGSNVYLVWDGYYGASPTANVSVSRDGGITFIQTPIILNMNSSSVSIPGIAVEGSNIYLAWPSEPGSIGAPNFDIVFAASLNGATTFGTPIVFDSTTSLPPFGAKAGRFALPQIAISGSNVFVLWADDISNSGFSPSQIRFTSSQDKGQSFSSVANLSNNRNADSQQGRLAASGDKVYVVWSTDSNVPHLSGVFLNVGQLITGQPVLFGTPVNVSSGIDILARGAEPQIIAQGNTFYLVWNSHYPTTNSGLYFAKGTLSAVGTVSVGPPMYLSTTPGNVSSPKFALDGGHIYVVWQDSSSKAVLLRTSSNGGMTWGNVVTLSLSGQNPQIVAMGGIANVVWADSSPGTPSIRFASVIPDDSNGTRVQMSVIVATLNSLNWWSQPQLVESGGQLHVTWEDTDSTGLTRRIMNRSSELTNFSLTIPLSDNNLVVNQGQDANTTIDANQLKGFTQSINFSESIPTLPPGAGAITLEPKSCIPIGMPTTCSTHVKLKTSSGTTPGTYNVLIGGTMGSVSQSTIWTVTVLDSTIPTISTHNLTAPADGFLPKMSYAGSTIAWFPGQPVPTVSVGTKQVAIQISAADNVEVTSVVVTCSPSCGRVMAPKDVTGQYTAVVSISNPVTQLTMQATDAASNIDVTYLNVELKNDFDSDGITNNVDGDCTTATPTSNSFNPSNRFCDLPLGGKTSGQVVAKDPNITLNISDAIMRSGGLVIDAVGPVEEKATLLLDGPSNGQPIYVYGGSHLTITDDSSATTMIQVTKGWVEIGLGSTKTVVVPKGGEVRITPTIKHITVTHVTIAAVRGSVMVNGGSVAQGKSITVPIAN